MSFIMPSHRKEKIHKFGHMHLDDFLERAAKFKNEVIVCAHFSTRYHPDQVRRFLEKKLPAGLRERIKVWI
jgi:ribonuclease Z